MTLAPSLIHGSLMHLGLGHNWYAFPDKWATGEHCVVGGCGNTADGWLTVHVRFASFKGEIVVALCNDDAAEWTR